MPELPETTLLARQLNEALPGRAISSVEIRQPKCLNVGPAAFVEHTTGKTFGEVTVRGKWILADLRPGQVRLCLNLGMGGEVLLIAPETAMPEKWVVRMGLADSHLIAIRFWWFGYVHLALPGVSGPWDELGPSPLAMSCAEFRRILRRSPAAGVKSLLLDQRRIAGVGNVYVQDPLWMARVHPMRKVRSLTDDEIDALYKALRERLELAVANNGSRHELDIYGRPGNWGKEEYFVAYRGGEPCPRCGTPVAKIKTGATSTFICPECQRM